MFNLTQSITDTIEKESLGSETYNPVYSTSMDLLDYRNGWIEDGIKKLGINGGKILTIVGKSSSGKSTLAEQIAWNIVKDEANGQIIHLDYERAGNKARISKITGIPVKDINPKGKKYCFLNSNIYSETLYKLVKSISKIKLENRDQLEKEDDRGHKYLPPTVLIVDSQAAMTPQDIADEKELSGSMSASSIAKTNNAIIKRLNNIIGDANIIIIFINHVTKKIEIG